jgi:hypothetical protein
MCGLPIRQPDVLTPHPKRDQIRSSLFQGRKCLRLDDSGLMMEAGPERERRREDRQNGDQTHTHTSPLRTRYALLTELTVSI